MLAQIREHVGSVPVGVGADEMRGRVVDRCPGPGEGEVVVGDRLVEVDAEVERRPKRERIGRDPRPDPARPRHEVAEPREQATAYPAPVVPRDGLGDVAMPEPPGRRLARRVEEGLERVGRLARPEGVDVDRRMLGLQPRTELELRPATAVEQNEPPGPEGERMVPAHDPIGDPLLRQHGLERGGRVPEQQRQAGQGPRRDRHESPPSVTAVQHVMSRADGQARKIGLRASASVSRCSIETESNRRSSSRPSRAVTNHRSRTGPPAGYIQRPRRSSIHLIARLGSHGLRASSDRAFLSITMNRPPGRSTRLASEMTAATSPTCSSVSTAITASNVESANGRRRADALTPRQSARLSEHPRRDVDADDPAPAPFEMAREATLAAAEVEDLGIVDPGEVLQDRRQPAIGPVDIDLEPTDERVEPRGDLGVVERGDGHDALRIRVNSRCLKWRTATETPESEQKASPSSPSRKPSLPK